MLPSKASEEKFAKIFIVVNQLPARLNFVTHCQSS
jgi:hypothetical protein